MTRPAVRGRALNTGIDSGRNTHDDRDARAQKWPETDAHARSHGCRCVGGVSNRVRADEPGSDRFDVLYLCVSSSFPLSHPFLMPVAAVHRMFACGLFSRCSSCCFDPTRSQLRAHASVSSCRAEAKPRAGFLSAVAARECIAMLSICSIYSIFACVLRSVGCVARACSACCARCSISIVRPSVKIGKRELRERGTNKSKQPAAASSTQDPI